MLAVRRWGLLGVVLAQPLAALVLAEVLRAAGPAQALLVPVLAVACAAVLAQALAAPVLAAACAAVLALALLAPVLAAGYAAFLALALLVPVLAGLCLVLALALDLGLGLRFGLLLPKLIFDEKLLVYERQHALPGSEAASNALFSSFASSVASSFASSSNSFASVFFTRPLSSKQHWIRTSCSMKGKKVLWCSMAVE